MSYFTSFFVYIITNRERTVLYTGITNDLELRLQQHFLSRGNQSSFTGRYHVFYLLHCEEFQNPTEAIAREKEIKGWRREKKMKLIQSTNPKLVFLNDGMFK